MRVPPWRSSTWPPVGGGEGLAVGVALSCYAVEYFHATPGIEWLRIAFRPDNPYPEAMYGEFGRRSADGRTSLSLTTELLTRDATAESGDEPSVRSATARDVRKLRRELERRGMVALDRAEQLDDAPLVGVSALYSLVGLRRGRTVLVAEDPESSCGAAFALVERSSPGLNFSELTNASRLLDFGATAPTVAALAAAAARIPVSRGVRVAPVLASGSAASALQLAGWTPSRRYTTWYVRCDRWREFIDFVGGALP